MSEEKTVALLPYVTLGRKLACAQKRIQQKISGFFLSGTFQVKKCFFGEMKMLFNFGYMSSESQFFQCHFLAPRFPLKFFSASICTISFIAIFIFCSQKHKNSIENASNFNPIATKHHQWWSLRISHSKRSKSILWWVRIVSGVLYSFWLSLTFILSYQTFGGKMRSR